MAALDHRLAIHRGQEDGPAKRLLHSVHLLQRVHVHHHHHHRVLPAGKSKFFNYYWSRIQSFKHGKAVVVQFIIKLFLFQDLNLISPLLRAGLHHDRPVRPRLVGDCEAAAGAGASAGGEEGQQQALGLEVGRRRMIGGLVSRSDGFSNKQHWFHSVVPSQHSLLMQQQSLQREKMPFKK